MLTRSSPIRAVQIPTGNRTIPATQSRADQTSAADSFRTTTGIETKAFSSKEIRRFFFIVLSPGIPRGA
jgi:hypothetical protein